MFLGNGYQKEKESGKSREKKKRRKERIGKRSGWERKSERQREQSMTASLLTCHGMLQKEGIHVMEMLSEYGLLLPFCLEVSIFYNLYCAPAISLWDTSDRCWSYQREVIHR